MTKEEALALQKAVEERRAAWENCRIQQRQLERGFAEMEDEALCALAAAGLQESEVDKLMGRIAKIQADMATGHENLQSVLHHLQEKLMWAKRPQVRVWRPRDTQDLPRIERFMFEKRTPQRICLRFLGMAYNFALNGTNAQGYRIHKEDLDACLRGFPEEK